MDDLQCSERARPCADTAGDTIPFKAEIGIDQFEGILGTDCNAGAAVSTLVSVYPEHRIYVVVVIAKTFMFSGSGMRRGPLSGCAIDRAFSRADDDTA
jgi:hypothetical protein